MISTHVMTSSFIFFIIKVRFCHSAFQWKSRESKWSIYLTRSDRGTVNNKKNTESMTTNDYIMFCASWIESHYIVEVWKFNVITQSLIWAPLLLVNVITIEFVGPSPWNEFLRNGYLDTMIPYPNRNPHTHTQRQRQRQNDKNHERYLRIKAENI